VRVDKRGKTMPTWGLEKRVREGREYLRILEKAKREPRCENGRDNGTEMGVGIHGERRERTTPKL